MGIFKTRTATGRRRLLSVLAAGIAIGSTVSTGLSAPALAAATTESGTDLSGWTTVVGDGVYAAPGQAPVTSADIAAEDHGTDTRVRANIRNRGIMAHAITYKRVTDPSLMQRVHQGGYSFQMPYVPSTAGGPRNAQTVEGGLFVWDGVTTKVDHGTAFQWVLNPWQSNFGQVSVWTGNSWTRAGYLKPDTAWHNVSFMVDPAKQKVRLVLDGVDLNAPYSRTPKSGWATSVSASLQVEAISLYPGANATTGPQHEVLVRNWSWTRGSTPAEDAAASKDCTFHATQPSGGGGNWNHTYQVKMAADGKFSGTNVIVGLDGGNTVTVNESVTGQITDKDNNGVKEVTVASIRDSGFYTFAWNVADAPMDGVADRMDVGTVSYATAENWNGGELPITFTAAQCSTP
ncbi:hypothetical protein [Actinoplanes sp. NPDC026623]|uniref:hypothetical protein n=1 Tax=Actinoplanes sp. NPDC026623 TaxID=3155610 RepID=UPI0033C499AF